MSEYLRRSDVLRKIDDMIAYWENHDDCTLHTLQVVRSAIVGLPVSEGQMCVFWESCDHYALCNKDKPVMCHCMGNTAKCDLAKPKK